MREFNLDLLISKNVAVNCKTVEESNEFLKFLECKGIKWCNGVDIFKSKEYYFALFKEKTCFNFHKNKGLQFEGVNYFRKEFYEILSLDDLVINIKNNFKEYGFEADFEGEILKEVNGYYIGWAKIEGYETNACKWNKKGIANLEWYNIKPIKKEWYLDKDNFEAYKGKIIINKYGNIRMIQSIDDNKVSTFEQNMYHYIIRVEEWRPATKEEVLSLIVKE